LYEQERFRTFYPSEHVVRFLAGLEPRTYMGAAIDIGSGAGRHSCLLADFYYMVTSCDASSQAILETRKATSKWFFAHWPSKSVTSGPGPNRFTDFHAPMTALPVADESFDVALSYGVFYYGSRDDGDKAVEEMHRVLRPGGKGFVNVRTDRDWRNHYSRSGHPEEGMPMHFLAEDDIPIVYGSFTHITWELTETTTHQCTALNSDWLITVTK
jgi:SAM-dependent methyltransferase